MQSSQQKESEWKEEFDTKVRQYVNGHGRDHLRIQNGWWLNEEDLDEEAIKDFISDLLLSQEERIREELQILKEEARVGENWVNDGTLMQNRIQQVIDRLSTINNVL